MSAMTQSPPRSVLALSSLVSRGSVGLRASGFAIERLGVPVIKLPTVLLPWHPGHAKRFGSPKRIVPEDAAFAANLEALADAEFASEIGAVLTGYFVSAAQVTATCAAIDALRERVPDLVVLVDPVCADRGGSYVASETIDAIANALVPRADIITPNRFEAALLAGAPAPEDNADIIALASKMPVQSVIVTSAFGMMRDSLGVVVMHDRKASLLEHQSVKLAPNGTGDLFSGLMAAHTMKGRGLSESAKLATASVFELVARTAKLGRDELAFAEEQDCIMRPMAMVHERQLVRPRASV